ncbi:hypothetical protein B5G26_14295 [Anaerotignum lactatifermentans]|uniref:Uncharacterized protein n=1 Tax=Anaerotignum lactatifermentans TaxID=160404 RepID=A0A1Y3TUU2_9FIRM|nr:hypothetical protein B5G26_14295 [Anaerotignum lactatifermentans]
MCLHDNVAYQIKIIEILSSFSIQKIQNNHFFCLLPYNFYSNLLCTIQIKFIVLEIILLLSTLHVVVVG